ncbi:predicted protein [Naegleria gruberi]|uniref:Predicted protein n=1 Tax=Naegleria gruberi TaxID=5762 RepID=D2VT34_NAEGR|nr:uncharacterized protein NAEGRDRAFT_72158 [Naegleria gruberi]EFC40077.1 predicted protein [Naegleria gruberi]|eukprot:XP_002672821.1 predicted protein [Naegleria gruberi strain NEG-M]
MFIRRTLLQRRNLFKVQSTRVNYFVALAKLGCYNEQFHIALFHRNEDSNKLELENRFRICSGGLENIKDKQINGGLIGQEFNQNENPFKSTKSLLDYKKQIKLEIENIVKGKQTNNATDEFLSLLIKNKETKEGIFYGIPSFLIDTIKKQLKSDILKDNEEWLFDYVFNAFKTNPLLKEYASNLYSCHLLKKYLTEYVSLNLEIIEFKKEIDNAVDETLEKELFESVFYFANYGLAMKLLSREETILMKNICQKHNEWSLLNKDDTLFDLETGMDIKINSCIELVRAVIDIVEGNYTQAETLLKKAIELDQNNVYAKGFILKECTHNLYPDNMEETKRNIERITEIFDNLRNRNSDNFPLCFSDYFILKGSVLLHAASLVQSTRNSSSEFVEFIEESKKYLELSEKGSKIPQHNIVNLINKAKVHILLEDYGTALFNIEKLLAVNFVLTEYQLRECIIVMANSLRLSGKAQEAIRRMEPYVKEPNSDIDLRYAWLLAHESLIEQSENKKAAFDICMLEYQSLLDWITDNPESNPYIYWSQITQLEQRIEQLSLKYQKLTWK